MKAIDFAVSRILPEDLRQENYDLSKKGMASLMASVASRHPDEFPRIVKALGDLGRKAVFRQGYTTSAKDTRQVIDTSKYYAKMDAELAHLKKENLPPKEFDARREDIMTRYSDAIEVDTVREATRRGNAFAMAVNSGARGNASHVKSILSTPGIFQDSKGKIIPMFVRNSFGDGMRPAELLAGTYGSRTSVVSTKTATAKGGDLLKIMTQSTSNYNITENDCGVADGIALESDDNSLSGRVLGRAAGDMPAGTVVDRPVLAKLRRAGKPVVARSALTCTAKSGVCAKCAGVQSNGKFPKIGESVGVTASAAIGEPIVQGSLNVKHNAGMAKGKKSYSGLEYISQFMQIPEEFKDRAAVAERDGIVEKIKEAPQGGTIITVDGEDHFVMPGFGVEVKVGQSVEAGQQLSDGLVNPADIVRLKGLGAGRKYYADRLTQMLRDSGQNPEPRNVELLARAAVDTYTIDDPGEEDPWLPDDSVRSVEFLRNYKRAADTKEYEPNAAKGKYLQTPVLHHTIGTRVTPSIIKDMERVGVKKVLASQDKPWFSPQMKRIRTASHDSDDWLASMGTSYLGSQLRNSLERGEETDVAENAHFGPRLAFGGDAGKGGFGENIETTGKF